MKSPTLSILNFHKLFPDNETCLKHLFGQFYSTAKCPKCGRSGQYHLQFGTSHFVCSCGGHQISPKKSTTFEKSDTDLVKWYFAIFLMSQSRNGVAAKEIERACEVTYKTAWRMAKQIRTLMQEDPELLWGEVEADETMVGGRRSGKRGRGAAGKTIVFGAMQREGKLDTAVVPNVKADTLLPHLHDHIAKGTDLTTDELKSYKKIATVMDVNRRTVEHGKHQYAKPDGTHTNSIEGFWSQLKRSLDGTHHVVSPKYLPLYVSEFQWRYNNRDSAFHLFDLLLSRVGLLHVGVMKRIGGYRSLRSA